MDVFCSLNEDEDLLDKQFSNNDEIVAIKSVTTLPARTHDPETWVCGFFRKKYRVASCRPQDLS